MRPASVMPASLRYLAGATVSLTALGLFVIPSGGAAAAQSATSSKPSPPIEALARNGPVWAPAVEGEPPPLSTFVRANSQMATPALAQNFSVIADSDLRLDHDGQPPSAPPASKPPSSVTSPTEAVTPAAGADVRPEQDKTVDGAAASLGSLLSGLGGAVLGCLTVLPFAGSRRQTAAADDGTPTPATDGSGRQPNQADPEA